MISSSGSFTSGSSRAALTRRAHAACRLSSLSSVSNRLANATKDCTSPDLAQAVTEVPSVDPVHHEDPPARQSVMDRRDFDGALVLEVDPEPLDVGRLVDVVELGEDRAFELPGDRRQVDTTHEPSNE